MALVIKQTLETQQRRNSNACRSLALPDNHGHRFLPASSLKIVEPSGQASNRKKNLRLLSSILQNLDICPTYSQPPSIPGVAVSQKHDIVYIRFVTYLIAARASKSLSEYPLLPSPFEVMF